MQFIRTKKKWNYARRGNPQKNQLKDKEILILKFCKFDQCNVSYFLFLFCNFSFDGRKRTKRFSNMSASSIYLSFDSDESDDNYNDENEFEGSQKVVEMTFSGKR